MQGASTLLIYQSLLRLEQQTVVDARNLLSLNSLEPQEITSPIVRILHMNHGSTDESLSFARPASEVWPGTSRVSWQKLCDRITLNPCEKENAIGSTEWAGRIYRGCLW